GDDDGEGDGEGLEVSRGSGSGSGEVVTVGTGSGVVPPVRSPTAASAGPATSTPADDASASTSAARVTLFGARVMTIRSNQQGVRNVRAAPRWRRSPGRRAGLLRGRRRRHCSPATYAAHPSRSTPPAGPGLPRC